MNLEQAYYEELGSQGLPLDHDLYGPGQVIPDPAPGADKLLHAIDNAIAAGDIDHAQDLMADMTPEQRQQWEARPVVETPTRPGAKF